MGATTTNSLLGEPDGALNVLHMVYQSHLVGIVLGFWLLCNWGLLEPLLVLSHNLGSLCLVRFDLSFIVFNEHVVGTQSLANFDDERVIGKIRVDVWRVHDAHMDP